MNGGIGLRQVCDWLMYMYKNYEKIDSEQLQRIFEVSRYRQTMGTVCFDGSEIYGLSE